MGTGAASKASNLQFESSGVTRQFRCAVSLHSHTLHSRESLDFIYRYAKRVGLIRAVIERGENKYRAIHASELDLSRAWWTPPLGPHDAWVLERDQIERRLGLRAIVSLTDHDDIEAALALAYSKRAATCRFQWSGPFLIGTRFSISACTIFGRIRPEKRCAGWPPLLRIQRPRRLDR
jgi:hypothetical protein